MPIAARLVFTTCVGRLQAGPPQVYKMAVLRPRPARRRAVGRSGKTGRRVRPCSRACRRQVLIRRYLWEAGERVSDSRQRPSVDGVVERAPQSCVREQRPVQVEPEEVDAHLRVEEVLLLPSLRRLAPGAVARCNPPDVHWVDAGLYVVELAGFDFAQDLVCRGADCEGDPLEAVGAATLVVRVAFQHDALPGNM